MDNVNLEEQLRGMILSNANSTSTPYSGSPMISNTVAQSYTIRSQNRQQESGAYFQASSMIQPESPKQNATAHSNTSKQSTPRKRPNQAQRRQMSSQLDITPTHIPSSQGFQAVAHHIPKPSQGSNDFQNHRRPSFGPQNSAHPSESSRSSWQANHRHAPQGTGNHRQQYQPSGHRGGWGGSHPNQGLHKNHQEPSYRAPDRHFQNNQNSAQGFVAFTADEIESQAMALEHLLWTEVEKAEMTLEEVNEKDALRAKLETICQTAVLAHEHSSGQDHITAKDVSLQCFGSVRSGFATKASDMDLALISPLSEPPASSRESPIPRILEKRLLDLGFGARLLTRTRVPIIKFCEKPSQELLELLRAEHKKWKQEADSNNHIEDAEQIDVGAQRRERKGTDASSRLGISHHKSSSEASTQEDKVNIKISAALNSIRQIPRESLYSYYRRIRGIMTDAGISDFHRGQKEILDLDEFGKLLQFVERFVLGIEDERLRQCLLNMPSMDCQAAYHSGRVISLYGTWLQAEGERNVCAWETRNVKETLDTKEEELSNLVGEWKSLVNSTDVTTNHRIQSLRRMSENFKSFASIRLATLSQSKDESVNNYRSRALTILKDLNAKDLLPGSDQAWLPTDIRIVRELTHKFVSGIYEDSPKDAVTRFVSSRSNVSMSEVSNQLEAEYRIWNYEKAVTLNKFTGEEKVVISEYTSLVRQYGVSSANPAVGLAAKNLEKISDPSPKTNRDRFGSPLDFPKQGVGIQCDINFSNILALYNTALLRCYSICDIRVRPMVLFIKAWAKKRMINSPYHGTLSSYGYVLMVLHYLVNVAQPPVLPNLQLEGIKLGFSDQVVESYNVMFWGDEKSIMSHVANGTLMPIRNQQPLGFLLRGFFDYYARQGTYVTGRGFWWANDVLSLRTQGGLLTKQSKGWTGAKTTITEAQGDEGRREVRHRYLMAIEDPFEVDHNVARTVMHDGIVKIRDEFRRAWALISSSTSESGQGDLGILFDNRDPDEKTG